MATVRRIKAAWPAMRELFAEKPGPRTSLDRVVGPHRTLALIRGNLQVVEDVAHAHAATVNDVLLTMIAGGLRALSTAAASGSRTSTYRSTCPSHCAGTGPLVPRGI